MCFVNISNNGIKTTNVLFGNHVCKCLNPILRQIDTFYDFVYLRAHKSNPKGRISRNDNVGNF